MDNLTIQQHLSLQHLILLIFLQALINLGKSNHKCHMIDSDIWGSKSNIDKNNICIGSLQREINIDNK